MKEIYLVRHGETEWNKIGKYQGRTDIPLSQKGLDQAALCAEALRSKKIDRIITSDLSRAKVTAETIRKFHQSATFTIDKRLQELNFGDWETLTYDEINERWPGQIHAMYKNPETMTIQNGESFFDLQVRAWAALEEELSRSKDGDTILVVCHGGTIRTLICKLLDINLRHCWNFRNGNTAISCIEYHDNEYPNMLSLLNDVAHIKDL